MMKKSEKAMLAVATATASTSVLAHPGHDHGANTAMLSHVLFYGSIVAGLALIAFAAVKYFSRTK